MPKLGHVSISKLLNDIFKNTTKLKQHIYYTNVIKMCEFQQEKIIRYSLNEKEYRIHRLALQTPDIRTFIFRITLEGHTV